MHIAYLAFGATFMIYGTFIVTTMINEYHLDAKVAGAYWSWVGGFSLFSGLAFGTLSDRIGRRRGLLAVFVVPTSISGAATSTGRWATSVLGVTAWNAAAISLPLSSSPE